LAGERPEAQVELRGDQVLASAENLNQPRLRMFFEFVLSGEEVESGWLCPVGSAEPSELLLRIAGELQRHGYDVGAADTTTDAVLERDLERVRSYERARKAGREYLGLGGERLAILDPDKVIAGLEEIGWSEDRALHTHQRESLMHALSATNTANFSVPGAGKTATALAVAATHLSRETIELIVVVGPLSCFRPWEKEAAAAIPGLLSPRRIRGLNPAARTEVYRQQVGARELLLLSYATAAHDRPELERLFQKFKTMLIVDESHRVKRFEGGRWAPALVALARHARVRMILSGTPMPQGPKDLWSQFNILWPGEEATGSRGSFKALARANFDSIKHRVEPFFTRTPKSELKIPKAVFCEPPVEMPPIQREIYELIFQRLRTTIAIDASWNEKVERLRRALPIRLIQAASNPDLLNLKDGFFEIPPVQVQDGTLMERLHNYRSLGELPAKFKWTLDYLAGLKAEKEKCVVWTTFVRNVDQFAALVEEHLGGPVFCVDGRIPAAETADPELRVSTEGEEESGEELDETREQRIDDFLSSEGFAVLIANPAACAESISLHSHCFRAAYLDRTHDCARWLQSIDRIHRLGLPEGVTVEVQVPIAKIDGLLTVDDLIDQSLRTKEARMKALLDDAELRSSGLSDQDTLAAAEGSDADLETLLRYLLGEL
jgi:hypothetical protein